MTTFVRYTPEDRVLDLSELSLAEYELVAGLRGNIRRGDRVLICLMPGAGDSQMYIRKDGDDTYRAVHFPGGAHGPHPLALETIEHRRQKEYWARAATDHGLHAALEVSVKGAGVIDVAITGGDIDTDIEIQRAPITAATVKARTSRYANAGYMPIWFNDAGARPSWLKEVPALGCNAMPWHVTLPGRRQVTATGLGVLSIVRCDISHFGGTCPVTGRHPCGKRHPLVTAGRIGVTVDDVAAMLPAGQLVPLRYRSGTAYLVSPQDLATYKDMTGGQGDWKPGGKTAPGKRAIRQKPEICRNSSHNDQPAPPITRHPAEPVPSERLRPEARGRLICPGCRESELAYGRTICQSCRLLAAHYGRI
jgi:hypothetical protein